MCWMQSAFGWSRHNRLWLQFLQNASRWLAEDNSSDQNAFTCELCHKMHRLREEALVSTSDSAGLEIRLNTLELSPEVDQCRKEIEAAQERVSKIEGLEKNAEDYMYQHFEDIKRKADSRREEWKVKRPSSRPLRWDLSRRFLNVFHQGLFVLNYFHSKSSLIQLFWKKTSRVVWMIYVSYTSQRWQLECRATRDGFKGEGVENTLTVTEAQPMS